MLLDEDPATLIHHTIGNFNIAPDKTAISRIQESLSTLQQARSLRLREAETALRQLSRREATLSNRHAETLNSTSSSTHASTILALDTQKFRIAKAASDLEVESERLEAELEALRSKLQTIELQGVEGDENERTKREAEDEVVLRLKVYRSLGMDLETEGGNEGGGVKKVVVRSKEKGDVHVVQVDPKFSRFFYANYFWGSM